MSRNALAPTSPHTLFMAGALLASLSLGAQALAQEYELAVDINTYGATDFGSDPRDFVEWHGHMLFGARSDAEGYEPWISDGTPQGTRRILDVAPGSPDGLLSKLVPFGPRFYFAGSDGKHGKELWGSDGTPQGTQLVVDLTPGIADSDIRSLCVANGQLFFRVGPDIYVSDGTAQGTRNIQSLTAPPRFAANTTTALLPTPAGIYFFADDGSRGFEPWFSDGQPGKARLVAELEPGSAPARIADTREMLALGSALVVNFDNASSGAEELHYLDATTQSIFELTNAQTSQARIQFGSVWSAGGRIWARGATGAQNTFVADAVAGSIRQLKNSQDGDPSLARAVFEFNGQVWLIAADGQRNLRFWKSDGSPTGASIAHLAPILSTNYYFEHPVVGKSCFYFSANSSEIWRSDGTATGTRVCMYNGKPMWYLVLPPFSTWTATSFGDRLVLPYEDYRGREPWITDGSQTEPLANIWLPAGAGSSNPSDINVHEGKLCFTANDTLHGRELYVSDGSTTGTKRIADIHVGPGSSSIRDLYSALGLLWFNASDGSSLYEAYVSDGTPQGTRKLGFAAPGYTGVIQKVSEFDGLAFFTSGYDATTWVSDGTAAGTRRMSQALSGPNLDSVHLTRARAGDRLYFVPLSDDNRGGFYVLDGGTRQLRLVPMSQGPDFTSIVGARDGALYFTTRDRGQEILWSTHGSQASTQPHASAYQLQAWVSNERIWYSTHDLNPNRTALWIDDGSPQGPRQLLGSPDRYEVVFLCETGGKLFFKLMLGSSPNAGLWVSDGTGNGTLKLPAIVASNQALSIQPGAIYFVSLSKSPEQKLWYSDGTVAGTYEVEARHPVPPLSYAGFGQPIGGRIAFLGHSQQWGNELFITKPAAGRHPVGRSCGPNGTWLDSDAPHIGQTMGVEGGSAPLGSAGLFLLGGISQRPLPIGGVDCRLQVDPLTLAIVHPFVVTQSDWQLPVPIPQDSGLLHLGFAMQALYLSPRTLEASAGLQAKIGR